MGTPEYHENIVNCFIDSDGPVADFDRSLKQSGMHADEFKHLPGTYLWLPITPGAEVCLNRLWLLDNANKIRIWILTKTPSNCPYAYTEKVLWYRRNFPHLEDRVILSHDKSILGSERDFLLDDRPHKANANKFRGTFVKFDPAEPYRDWANFTKMIVDLFD